MYFTVSCILLAKTENNLGDREQFVIFSVLSIEKFYSILEHFFSIVFKNSGISVLIMENYHGFSSGYEIVSNHVTWWDPGFNLDPAPSDYHLVPALKEAPWCWAVQRRWWRHNGGDPLVNTAGCSFLGRYDAKTGRTIR